VAVVVLLAKLSVAKDGFAYFSRPVVVGLIDLFGGNAVDHGATITVGRLEVPWSADCAGLNLLVLLLAVAVWMNRHEPMGWRYWLRILLMIPAAAIANVLRIFMILAYRDLFYPEIESPQLHYFFGLVLLVPFSLLALPRGTRSLSSRIFELLHVAAVIALLAPNASGAEGAALTIAVVLGLSNCRIPDRFTRVRLGCVALWFISAAGIAYSGMESFWLPWLLLCPLVCDPRWIFSVPGALVTLVSHRLVFLLPGGEWAVWAVIAYAVWLKFSEEEPSTSPSQAPGPWSGAGKVIGLFASIAFLLPFLSSTLLSGKKENWTPPSGALVHPVPGGVMVMLPGQTEQIGLLWYDSRGSERHHKLAICLSYRGIELVPSDNVPEVFTDGTHWMKEYYLQGGKLLQNHREYVLSTLGPGKSAGVHLILVSKKTSMSAADFSLKAGQISQELYARIQKDKISPSAD
jgi:exosortase/archaeosortase family protein